MSAEQAYLNGAFIDAADARVPVLDRGFLFADSVYEVVPVYDSQPFALNEHLARLRRSLDEVAIPFDDLAGLPAICETLIQRRGGGDLSLYLQITRGVDPVRDHQIRPALTPTCLVLTQPGNAALAVDVREARPIQLVTLPDIRWGRCDIKSTALLANILLRQMAAQRQAAEAILIREGQVTECASANLFYVIDGVMMTPPKGPWVLAGVTRDIHLQLAAEAGIAHAEQAVSEAELARASEVWISSSTRESVPVSHIDGRPVGDGQPGPVWGRMAELYQAFKRRTFG